MRVKVVAAVTVGFLLGACSAEKKANKAFTLGKYETVISYYKDVIKKQPGNGVANYYVAESYRQSNRIQESEPYYAKAGGKGINPDSAKLYYAKALQANAKYTEAREVLQSLASNTKDEKLKDRAGKELAGIDYLDKLEQKKSFYKIKNLDSIKLKIWRPSILPLPNTLLFILTISYILLLREPMLKSMKPRVLRLPICM